jgi:ABC-type amino acid transport substrate-binding protein
VRKGLLVFLFCLFLQWNLAPPVCAAGRLKVGVHNNQPLAFVDADGQAKGFLIDILEYIGAKEGWRLDYIPGSLTECLERLRKETKSTISPTKMYSLTGVQSTLKKVRI